MSFADVLSSVSLLSFKSLEKTLSKTKAIVVRDVFWKNILISHELTINTSSLQCFVNSYANVYFSLKLKSMITQCIYGFKTKKKIILVNVYLGAHYVRSYLE